MYLHEYQAKKLFEEFGLPIPQGYVCNSISSADKAITKLGLGPWIMKCQVHAGGRGKSGGVRIINNKKEMHDFSNQWLGKYLVTKQTTKQGLPVNKILIEKITNIKTELYLGAIIDHITCNIIIMASREGGMEIEEVAQNTPHLIYKIHLDPLIGPQSYQGRILAFKLGLFGTQITEFVKIFINFAKMFVKLDLSLAEINPLVINTYGSLICLDGKLIIDSNAIFRQTKLQPMKDITQENSIESYAEQHLLNYVALEGNIGCMVNGAGLAMATMDMIQYLGGKPANFLDVGGSATAERVKEAFKIILSDKNIKAILVNIFGGIVRCDLIADGIINAINNITIRVPIIVRLEGNNAQIGTSNLEKSNLNIIATTSLKDAVQRVISVVEDK